MGLGSIRWLGRKRGWPIWSTPARPAQTFSATHGSRAASARTHYDSLLAGTGQLTALWPGIPDAADRDCDERRSDPFRTTAGAANQASSKGSAQQRTRPARPWPVRDRERHAQTNRIEIHENVTTEGSVPGELSGSTPTGAMSVLVFRPPLHRDEQCFALGQDATIRISHCGGAEMLAPFHAILPATQ